MRLAVNFCGTPFQINRDVGRLFGAFKDLWSSGNFFGRFNPGIFQDSAFDADA